MRRQMKTWLALIALCSLLFFLPTFSSGQPKEILKFESGDTLDEIREKIAHNGYHFTVDHNWVYDMPSERKERFLARRLPLFPKRTALSRGIGPLDRHLWRQLPDQFDWRDYNGHSYIGPIRDQGSCGCCYAFAACAAAEGTYNRATGKYDENCADFSESFIMWCLGRLPEYSPHFYGCEGADYDYYELKALTAEGVCSEDDFPYTTSDPGSCTHWGDQTTVFKSWHRIDCNDIDAIKTAIMTYGVVDAAVYAESAFQAYSSGIYEDSNTSCYSSPCYYTPTNHAIALVGWNDNGDPENNGYWILRNSWGTSWGEEGYMRIKYTSALVACEPCYLVPEGSEVSTSSATSVTSTSAILNGTVNPGGLETVYYFEYGSTTAYGSTTTETDAGSGTDDVSVNAIITISDPIATYHYRLVATNAAGTSYGQESTFTNDTDTDSMPDDWERDYFGDLSHDGTLDGDDDDLTDLKEYRNGTDPTNPDTDSDDLPDGWEVNNGLDPLDATGDNGRNGDFDNDHWTNYQEYVNGTDPNEPESLPPNNAPTAPALNYPANDGETTSREPVLSVSNATDPDGHTLTYTFEIYSDLGLTSLVASVSGVQEGERTTGWQVDVVLEDNNFCYWRARAYDEIDYSGWMDTAKFFVNTSNDAPIPPSISSPQDGAEVATFAPNLEVNNSTDEDLDALTYFFEIDKVNTLDSLSLEQSPEVAEGAGDITSWHPSELADNTTYYWRAKAYDGAAYSDWSTGSFFVNLLNDAPTTPTINNPGNNSTVTTLTPTLTVNPSTDVDLDQITCDFELYSDSNLSNLVASISGAGTSWQVDVSLTNHVNYYWRVRAVDEHGATSEWSSAVSFFVNITRGNAGDDGGGSVFGIDCFIATAAYGFPMAKEVVVLRNFRDNVLLKNSLGRSLVKSYYKVAPPLADYIREHEALRTAARLTLTPLVYGVKYPKTSVLIFLFSVTAITLTLRLRRSSRF